MIVDKLFKWDSCDIYITSCTPVLHWNIDLYLTKKMAENIKSAFFQ